MMFMINIEENSCWHKTELFVDAIVHGKGDREEVVAADQPCMVR